MKKKGTRTVVLYLVIIVVLLVILATQLFGGGVNRPTQLSTSSFITAVNENRVSSVEYAASSGTVSGTYWTTTSEKDSGADPSRFTSTYVGDDSMTTLMADHPDIDYRVNVSSNSIWITLLTTLLPLLLVLGLMWYLFSQMNGATNKQMSFGKTKAKKSNEDRPTTKFSDVAGIDEAVEELDEVREFLANPAKYQALGAKIPHGVLLVGPPGTGKTLLARAVAGEAGVPFFSISGSDFVEMFVGVGASRVRDLFEQAKEAAPAIIFIDEIDAVGRQRGAGLGGGHDEREQTLNQLLVEMDGFDKNDTVILIAATNRVDILDPALLRPGRFDRQVVVDRPDYKGREKILEVHSKGKPLADDVNFETLAKLTPGFTGADLANLMNEAALLAARYNKRTISMTELDEAMERVIAGPARKSRIITDREKLTIAYHEGGHALVGHSLDNADPVHKITILPRGQALGYTMSLPTEDRFLNSRNEMYDELAMMVAGRVSEEIACDDITTGASNDLERATKIAKQMVTRYGMSEALGTQVFGEANHEVFLGRDYSATPDYSEETAGRIDEEVARIMRQAHERAYKILTEKREQLDLIAKVLIERETVEGKAAQALLDNRWDEYLIEEDEEKKRQQTQDANAEAIDRELAQRVARDAREKALESARRYQIPPADGGGAGQQPAQGSELPTQRLAPGAQQQPYAPQTPQQGQPQPRPYAPQQGQLPDQQPYQPQVPQQGQSQQPRTGAGGEQQPSDDDAPTEDHSHFE